MRRCDVGIRRREVNDNACNRVSSMRAGMEERQRIAVQQAATTSTRSFDNPEAYIPGDRRRALALAIPMPDRVHGAALFADISGFTPLTEALAKELGPQRGAEELTVYLNRVF